MKHSIFILAVAVVCVLAFQVQAATRGEQRTEIQTMKVDVLNRLYDVAPQAERQISEAAGYAVFSSADLAAVFVSGSYGRGVAYNNRNREEIYMRMASLGGGLGLGIKDFRTIFIFDNPQSFHDFTTTGLDLSAHADIAVKGGESGGALTGAVDVLPGVKVYQLTEAGLLAQMMLKGTKYWRDEDLNQYEKSSDARSAPAHNPVYGRQ
jgi:lipid-binding SYLF domain-containing protein